LSEKFTLKWQDTENEKIIIQNQEDWEIALQDTAELEPESKSVMMIFLENVEDIGDAQDSTEEVSSEDSGISDGPVEVVDSDNESEDLMTSKSDVSEEEIAP